MRYIIGSLAGASALALTLTSCAEVTTTQPEASIKWASCDSFTAQVTDFYKLMEMPSPTDGYEDRLQCGEVSVPLNYDDPKGRQLTIAVTKLAPENESTGYVLTNPGGPGLEGRTFPVMLAASPMRAVTEDLTLIGIDSRGTGGSTTVSCQGEESDVDPEAAVTEQLALAHAEHTAQRNQGCVDLDPEYVEQLTTQNIARDLDRVREALGAEKVSYFGVSWGTELGMEYLNAFPDRVDRMLLDSVMDVRQDITKSLDDIAAAVAAAPDPEPGTEDDTEGAEGAEGTEPGDTLAAAETFAPGSFDTRTAITCNAYGPTDAKAVWDDHGARTERLGADLQDRTAHPVSGELPGTSACAGWPFAAQPLQLSGKKFDNLQIVVHSGETVTPPVWGERAHELLGGSFTVVQNDQHGSLAYSDKAEEAVQFLVAGTPMK
ncbi:alpha/beta fold hydrolase [Leucobacter sp. cx-328]|uniref:alpha/beta hydrolase n=1 Tax=unclassified Leucobacter TaxID=2621730 RepID=UPI00165E4907|nr:MULTISPECIES: alpha/beta hydrolase [unclassified Leucobacter]MBC9944624.1 alpha/beta fold hydrolase [Leucobacter sp. cx-328]